MFEVRFFRIQIQNLQANYQDLLVVPNPANESVEIRLQNVTEGICRIRLINSLGKIILAREFNCSDTTIQLDISKFPPGMYVVEVLLPEHLYKNTKLVIFR